MELFLYYLNNSIWIRRRRHSRSWIQKGRDIKTEVLMPLNKRSITKTKWLFCFFKTGECCLIPILALDKVGHHIPTRSADAVLILVEIEPEE